MAGTLSLQQGPATWIWCLQQGPPATSASLLVPHKPIRSSGDKVCRITKPASAVLQRPFLKKFDIGLVPPSQRRQGQRGLREVAVAKWDGGTGESREEAARRLQRAAQEAAEQGAAAAARNAARGAEEAKRKADAAAAAALSKAAETLRNMNVQQSSGSTGAKVPSQGESEAEQKAREERQAKEDAEMRQRELDDFDRRLAESTGQQ